PPEPPPRPAPRSFRAWKVRELANLCGIHNRAPRLPIPMAPDRPERHAYGAIQELSRMTSHPFHARALLCAAALTAILSGCSGSDSAKPDGPQASVKADAGTPGSGSDAAPKAASGSTEMKGL